MIYVNETQKQKYPQLRRKKKTTTKRKKATPARSNKGGAVRGKARAAQVKRMKGATLTTSTNMAGTASPTGVKISLPSPTNPGPMKPRTSKKKVVAKKRTVKKKANPSGANKTAARIRTYNKGKGANTRGTTGYKKKTAAMLKKARRKGTLARGR